MLLKVWQVRLGPLAHSSAVKKWGSRQRTFTGRAVRLVPAATVSSDPTVMTPKCASLAALVLSVSARCRACSWTILRATVHERRCLKGCWGHQLARGTKCWILAMAPRLKLQDTLKPTEMQLSNTDPASVSPALHVEQCRLLQHSDET